MSQDLLFALISTLILVIGITPLWRDIIRWRTIPHPFTLWVWLILVSINIYILFQNEQYTAMIAPGVLWICLIWETIVGIRKIWKISINWFDYLCIFLSFTCVLYLLLFKNLENTAIFTIIIDFIALLPTFKKSWLQPWTETAWSFFVGGLSQFFTILALDAPNTETMIFWWYILVMDLLLTFFILIRRWHLKWWHSIFE